MPVNKTAFAKQHRILSALCVYHRQNCSTAETKSMGHGKIWPLTVSSPQNQLPENVSQICNFKKPENITFHLRVYKSSVGRFAP